MKFVSWNVNGFRAILTKGFAEIFAGLDADFFSLQETKMQEGQAEFAPLGYYQYWNSAIKKGYSGTAIFTKHKPLNVFYGINKDEHSLEGRAITLEYEGFYLVNIYTPNSQNALARIDYRMQWEDDLRSYLCQLNAKKPVIYCGDLNVAYNEIDLKNPKPNIGSAGFSYEERGKMTQLLEAGFADSFRLLHPDKTGAYTWWSYFRNARATNAGWRIDYFIISKALEDKVFAANIHADIFGSDHCPVSLEINL